VLSKAVADELETILEQNPGQNVNRLMNTALEEFIQRRRQREFELAMAEMAADPAVRKECSRIRRQFCTTDMDGLEK